MEQDMFYWKFTNLNIYLIENLNSLTIQNNALSNICALWSEQVDI